VIVETLRRVPADDLGRRVYLTALFDPSDTDKAEQFRRNFKSIARARIRGSSAAAVWQPSGGALTISQSSE